MKILALDPASSTGWATQGDSGSFRLVKGKHEDREAWHARLFDRASEHMAELVAMHQPAVLCIEGPSVAGMKGNQNPVALGLRAVFYVIARRHEMLIDPVPPATWQAWARPRGWTKSDDENDAIWIRDWWLAVRAPRVTSEAPAP